MAGGWLAFEVLGGWRFIMRDLLERIDATLRTDEERESFYISQVKEKYGTLAVYHNGDARIESLVDAAEAASRITCDVCGGRGRLQGRGWLSVRCTAHENWTG
jgi:hypothetical protein